MPQGPDWKQLLETGMNFTELGRAQARQIVSDLVSQGQVAQDKASAAVEEVLEMSRRRREDLRSLIQTEIQRQVGALGIATRDDLARLEKRLGATPAPPKKTPVKKVAAKTSAAAKKAPAKKASVAMGSARRQTEKKAPAAMVAEAPARGHE
jgi:polyhydroxyalkanoate synthesis regulator phasin